MSKSFAITLILCGICLIGSAVMDAIDMRNKLAVAEAKNVTLYNQMKAQELKASDLLKVEQAKYKLMLSIVQDK